MFAQVLVRPCAPAHVVLHAAPEQGFRIDAQLVRYAFPVDSGVVDQKLMDRGFFPLEVAGLDGVLVVGGASHAHEVAGAPFDDVGVEEQWLVARLVGGISLHHCDAGGSSVDEHGVEAEWDHVVIFFERSQCEREGILIAPPGIPLGCEGIVVIRSVIIVVGCQAKGLWD